jgi:hypothetical protein
VPAGGNVERDPVHVFGSVSRRLVSWQADYNGDRPHLQLEWCTPFEFAQIFVCDGHGDAQLEQLRACPGRSTRRTAQSQLTEQAQGWRKRGGNVKVK